MVNDRQTVQRRKPIDHTSTSSTGYLTNTNMDEFDEIKVICSNRNEIMQRGPSTLLIYGSASLIWNAPYCRFCVQEGIVRLHAIRSRTSKDVDHQSTNENWNALPIWLGGFMNCTRWNWTTDHRRGPRKRTRGRSLQHFRVDLRTDDWRQWKNLQHRMTRRRMCAGESLQEAETPRCYR